MIARIAAILRHTVRLLVRSRAVTTLAATALILAPLLTSLVSGDGTPEGDLRIMIQYPVAAVLALLVPATLLGGCALPSSEIASGRFQLTRIRPARSWEIWMGQWLGLSLLNALLVALAFLAIPLFAGMRAGRGPERNSPGLQPFAAVRPVLPEPRRAARRMLERARAAGTVPEDLSEAEILADLVRRMETAYLPLSPGETLTAEFRLPRPLASGETVQVRLVLRSPPAEVADLDGTLVLRNPRTAREIAVPIRDVARGELRYPFTIDETLAGTDRLVLALSRTGPADAPAVLYNLRRGLRLRVPRGSAGTNILKAAGITLSLLMLMAALGVTLGVMFSLPVAAFVATALLLSCGAARYAVSERLPGRPAPGPAIFARLSDGVVTAVSRAVDPAAGYRPGARLAERAWIPPASVARALLWRGGLYPAFLGLLACAALNRRETAS